MDNGDSSTRTGRPINGARRETHRHDAKAPAIGQAEAIVAAPIDTVCDVLCDLPNWPSWNKSVSSLELKGDLKPGTSYVRVVGGSKITSRREELERPAAG
jgi:hypothetical protein